MTYCTEMPEINKLIPYLIYCNRDRLKHIRSNESLVYMQLIQCSNILLTSILKFIRLEVKLPKMQFISGMDDYVYQGIFDVSPSLMTYFLNYNSVYSLKRRLLFGQDGVLESISRSGQRFVSSLQQMFFEWPFCCLRFSLVHQQQRSGTPLTCLFVSISDGHKGKHLSPTEKITLVNLIKTLDTECILRDHSHLLTKSEIRKALWAQIVPAFNEICGLNCDETKLRNCFTKIKRATNWEAHSVLYDDSQQ